MKGHPVLTLALHFQFSIFVLNVTKILHVCFFKKT